MMQPRGDTLAHTWVRDRSCVGWMKQQTMKRVEPMESEMMTQQSLWEQPALAGARNYLCLLDRLANGLPHPSGG